MREESVWDHVTSITRQPMTQQCFFSVPLDEHLSRDAHTLCSLPVQIGPVMANLRDACLIQALVMHHGVFCHVLTKQRRLKILPEAFHLSSAANERYYEVEEESSFL